MTVGTEGGQVPFAKFKQNAGKETALFLTDKEWQPLKDRVIPGSAEVTLIQPAKLFIELFDSVCKAVTEGERSWALFGEEYGADEYGYPLYLNHNTMKLMDLKSRFEEVLSIGSD